LILKELLQVANIKYVARAPKGKEVEDLNAREIEEALKNKVPVEDLLKRKKRKRRKILVPKEIGEAVKKLEGTREAILLDKDMNEIKRLPVSELADKLKDMDNVDTVVFDGVITQRLVDIASEKNIKYLVAVRISDVIKQPLNVKLLTFNNISD